MNIILNFISTAFVFFKFVSGFSGIIGGILLLISGDCRLALYLFFLSITAPFVLGLVMAPSLIFAGPAGMLLERGQKFFGNVLALLGGVWIAIVLGFYSASILFYVFDHATTFWGALLASYATAISPIIYMASKDPIYNDYDSINSMLTNFFAEVTLLIMIFFSVFSGLPYIDAVITYVVTFFIFSIIGIITMSLLFTDSRDETD